MIRISWIESKRHLEERNGARRKVYREYETDSIETAVAEIYNSLSTVYRNLPVKIQYREN